ncbi:MAG: cupredoxin domain-containing protein [Vulcanimicrobiaceae bacterium]
MSRNILVYATLLVLCAACTPGASGTGAITGGTVPGVGGKTVVIDVSLTLYQAAQLQQGEGGGYAPLVTSVSVGDNIRFINQDGFSNTATSIPSATTFPSGSPFSTSAQTQSGSALSQPWSSGTLPQSGSASQSILVDKAGTYLYGCFFHYGAPMRGVIVAQ